MRLTATSTRIDWKTERESIDLVALCTSLLGPAPGRRGEHGRRLWWPCPLHADSNPSFCVDPGKPWWKCFGCGEHGDAATLLMRLEGLTFPDAIRRLNGHQKPPFRVATKAASKPATPPPPPPSIEPTGLPRNEAEALVAVSAAALWSETGSVAIVYLTGPKRGLTPETIAKAGLGYCPGISVPTRDGDRFYHAEGIVIAWHGKDGRLALLKVRQPKGRKPKYSEVFRDPAALTGIYPAEAIKPGLPLVIVEGEFDALLLAQELAGLASVVTLGSASARPTGSTLALMLAASVWFIATDADNAGDRAAEGWPARAKRVRPPEGDNDWTEVHAGGFNRIRYWWLPLLGWKPDPAIFAEEWGLQTDPAEAAGLEDYDQAERMAIQAEATGIVMEAEADDRYSGSGNGAAANDPAPIRKPFVRGSAD